MLWHVWTKKFRSFLTRRKQCSRIRMNHRQEKRYFQWLMSTARSTTTIRSTRKETESLMQAVYTTVRR